MKRNIKKQIWMSRDEAEQLAKKARKACLTEAGLIRFLLRGYEPREKPDEEFYDAMRRMSDLTEEIRRLAYRADETGVIDQDALAEEINRWHRFQAEIEMEFLTPKGSELKWQ